MFASTGMHLLQGCTEQGAALLSAVRICTTYFGGVFRRCNTLLVTEALRQREAIQPGLSMQAVPRLWMCYLIFIGFMCTAVNKLRQPGRYPKCLAAR